jgi:hypothetical protein
MKPFDRMIEFRRRLDELAGVPIMFEGTGSLNYRNAVTLAELVTEARWLIAFTDKLIADGVEWTYENAKAQRDETRPHESEPADPLSQQFFEGAAYVRDRVRDWLHNDPEMWHGPDNPYAVDAGYPDMMTGIAVEPGAVVLEFERAEGAPNDD